MIDVRSGYHNTARHTSIAKYYTAYDTWTSRRFDKLSFEAPLRRRYSRC